MTGPSVISAGSSTSGSSGMDRVSLASQKAMMLSTKVKGIRNLIAPYQLRDAEPGSTLAGSTTHDDIHDIDDTDCDVSSSSSSDSECVDQAVEEGAVGVEDVLDVNRRLCSPFSPASVIASSDTVFSAEAGAVSSTSKKSKSTKSPKASSRRKSAGSPNRMRRTSTQSTLPKATIAREEDLGYEDCDEKRNSAQRKQTRLESAEKSIKEDNHHGDKMAMAPRSRRCSRRSSTGCVTQYEPCSTARMSPRIGSTGSGRGERCTITGLEGDHVNTRASCEKDQDSPPKRASPRLERRQQRRCSTGLLGGHLHGFNCDEGSHEKVEKSRSERRQQRRCSTGLIGDAGTGREGLPSTKDSPRSGHKQLRRCSTSFLGVNPEGINSDVDSHKKIEKSRSERRQQRRCSTGLISGHAQTGAEGLPTKKDSPRSGHRQQHRGTTSLLGGITHGGSINDEDSQKNIEQPRLERRQQRRCSTGFIVGDAGTGDEGLLTKKDSPRSEHSRRGTGFSGGDARTNSERLPTKEPGRRLHRRSSTGFLPDAVASDEGVPTKRVSPRSGRRQQRRGSTGLIGANRDGLPTSDEDMASNKAETPSSVRRQQRRGSTGFCDGNLGALANGALANDKDDSKVNELTGAAHGQHHHSSAHSRGEKSNSGGGEEKSPLKRHLSPGLKMKRRGSTGSLMDDFAKEDRSSAGLVTAESREWHLADDPCSTRDQSDKGSKVRASSQHGAQRKSEKRTKPRRFRRSKSFDPASAGSSIRNNRERDGPESSTGERKEAVSQQRSKFVNQSNIKVAHIDRRSRRNLIRDTGSDSFGARDQQASVSSSISSLTMSTGFVSKDASSLPSPNTRRPTESQNPGESRRTAAISRWQALPLKTLKNSSDGIPTRPQHDLSSICSTGKALNYSKHYPPGAEVPSTSTTEAAHTQHVALTSVCGLNSEMTTPSTISKNSSSLAGALLSGSLPAPPLEKQQGCSSSNAQIYPEILVPATPSRSTGGIVSELTTPGGTSELTTPRSHRGSLQSQLRKLPPAASALGGLYKHEGFVGELMTPYTKKSNHMLISVNQPNTPSSGVVSELTNGSSLLGDYSSSMLGDSHRGMLGKWMTGVQNMMLSEGEYNRDGVPRMARRHSLDSVSFFSEEITLKDSCNGQHRPPSFDSDFAPRAPSRQKSVASTNDGRA